MVARFVHIEEVIGSIPIVPTMKKSIFLFAGLVLIFLTLFLVSRALKTEKLPESGEENKAITETAEEKVTISEEEPVIPKSPEEETAEEEVIIPGEEPIIPESPEEY